MMLRVGLKDLRTLPEELSPLLEQLSPGRQARLAGYPPEARRQSLGGELLLAEMLGLSSPPKRQETPDGKPFLPDHPGLHFNLSHSGHLVVCALSSVPVGVDLEQERSLPDSLARRMHPDEAEALSQMTGEDFQTALFDLWVKKEAFTKCTGEGILRSFRSFRADAPEAGYAVCLLPPPRPGYHLALCLKAEEIPPVSIETY